MLKVKIIPKGAEPFQVTELMTQEVHFLNDASYGNLFDKGATADVVFISPENVVAVQIIEG